MLKIYTCFLMLVLTVVLFAERQHDYKEVLPSEIIDTVYAIDQLQGSIGYHIEANIYRGGVTPNGEYSLFVGDGYDMFTYSNVSERSYLSFPIEDFDSRYAIDSVSLCLFQRFSIANEMYYMTFPIWDGFGSNPLLVSRLDYGNTLEIADFNPLPRSEIGILSNDGAEGFRQLNITNDYITDWSNGRDKCQLMLYFNILSDYDQLQDEMGFDNMHYPYIENRPKLIIRYVNTTSSDDNHNESITGLSVYPNPIFTTATIQAKSGANLLSLDVYNTKGQKVQGVSRQSVSKSESKLMFDRSKLPSGLYIIRSTISENGRIHSKSNKVVLY